MDQTATRENAEIAPGVSLAPSAAALLALVLLTLIGFFVFPGHTYLQSDTLIYVPMFERMLDPSLFDREILTARQHTTYTAYDEITILLHRLTGLDYAYVLGAMQLLLRFAGLLGIYWIGTSLGLTEAGALLVAGLTGLGAFVYGPAVMTIELEPVPRGFAAHLTYLALGLALHRRLHWACFAIAVASAFHFPAVIPVLLVVIPVAVLARQRSSLGWLAAAVGLIALLAAFQSGARESQPIMATVDPEWEVLQKFRAAYNWIFSWRHGFLTECFVLGGICAFSCARLWRRFTRAHRIVFAGLTLIGVASLGVSIVAMEQWKWLLMAQVQPARATLFLYVLAVLLPAVCALDAARERRWWEVLPWACLACALPVLKVLTDTPYGQTQVITTAALTMLVGVAAWISQSKMPAAVVAPLLAAAAGAWMIPGYANGAYFRPIHHPELEQLSQWAAANTPKSAMFQFIGFGRRLEPSVFRARAKRALYWDYKAGGQVNYSRDFSMEWNKRRLELAKGGQDVAIWRALGVDFLVAEPDKPPAGLEPVYRNGRYAVFRVTNSSTSARSGTED